MSITTIEIPKKCNICCKVFQQYDLIAEIEIGGEELFCHFDCGSFSIEDAKDDGQSWCIEGFYCNGESLRKYNPEKFEYESSPLYSQLYHLISNGFEIRESKTIIFDSDKKEWKYVPRVDVPKEAIPKITDPKAFNEVLQNQIHGTISEFELEIRPEIVAFATRMEKRLQELDQTKGDSWKTTDIYEFLKAITLKFDKVSDIVSSRFLIATDVPLLVDIANYLMFLATRLEAKH